MGKLIIRSKWFLTFRKDNSKVVPFSCFKLLTIICYLLQRFIKILYPSFRFF